MRKFLLRRLARSTALVGLAWGLVACQSLPTEQTRPPADAKAHTAQALRKALRSGFAFSSHTKILPAGGAPVLDCAQTHDEAYVALAQQAIEDGFDISSDRYIDDRQRIKDRFLACAQSDAASFAYPNPKQAALVEAYLLGALEARVQGSYAPFQDSAAILPELSYRTGRLQAAINQPIYVDFAAGDVYFWADNWALASAWGLGSELGDQWQNRWLRLSLGDESLPPAFVKDALTFYVQARRESFGNADPSAFVWIDRDAFFAQEGIDPALREGVWRIVRHQDADPSAALRLFYQKTLAAYPSLAALPEENADPIDALALARRIFWYLKRTIDASEATDKAASVYYALDDRGGLLWTYSAQSGETPFGKDARFATLTRLGGDRGEVFERLPTQYRRPSRNDSVDLMAYWRERQSDAEPQTKGDAFAKGLATLMQRLESSDKK